MPLIVHTCHRLYKEEGIGIVADRDIQGLGIDRRADVGEDRGASSGIVGHRTTGQDGILYRLYGIGGGDTCGGQYPNVTAAHVSGIAVHDRAALVFNHEIEGIRTIGFCDDERDGIAFADIACCGIGKGHFRLKDIDNGRGAERNGGDAATHVVNHGVEGIGHQPGSAGRYGKRIAAAVATLAELPVAEVIVIIEGEGSRTACDIDLKIGAGAEADRAGARRIKVDRGSRRTGDGHRGVAAQAGRVDVAAVFVGDTVELVISVEQHCDESRGTGGIGRNDDIAVVAKGIAEGEVIGA